MTCAPPSPSTGGATLRQVMNDYDLYSMGIEARGAYDPGLFAFQIVGANCGQSLFRDADRGNPTACELLRVCYEFIEKVAATPGDVRCMLCAGPFTVALEEPWAVLLVHADIPQPSLVCCSGIRTRCVKTLDIDAIKRGTLAA